MFQKISEGLATLQFTDVKVEDYGKENRTGMPPEQHKTALEKGKVYIFTHGDIYLAIYEIWKI